MSGHGWKERHSEQMNDWRVGTEQKDPGVGSRGSHLIQPERDCGRFSLLPRGLTHHSEVRACPVQVGGGEAT